MLFRQDPGRVGLVLVIGGAGAKGYIKKVMDGDPIVTAIKLGRANAIGTPAPEPQAPPVAVVEPPATAIPGAMSPEEHAARVAAIPPMNPAYQQMPVQTPGPMPPGAPVTEGSALPVAPGQDAVVHVVQDVLEDVHLLAQIG